MAVLASDIQLSLAYRLGENGAPSDTNEKARRLSFINEGYRSVMIKHYWWFTETLDSFDTVANQESYGTADGLPSDVRQIIELRYQGTLYDQITQFDAMRADKTPYGRQANSYFIFAGKLYPIPKFGATVTDGVTLKYYKNYTKLTADASTILIPEMFSDILVAYAHARKSLISGKRGSAADSFDEYNELLNRMIEEQNKYLFSMKNGSNQADLENLFE